MVRERVFPDERLRDLVGVANVSQARLRRSVRMIAVRSVVTGMDALIATLDGMLEKLAGLVS
jgi:hypothetical protein